jgi:hypothetical protein
VAVAEEATEAVASWTEQASVPTTPLASGLPGRVDDMAAEVIKPSSGYPDMNLERLEVVCPDFWETAPILHALPQADPPPCREGTEQRAEPDGIDGKKSYVPPWPPLR